MTSLPQPQTYYIYTLIDPRNNQIYYVGQTTEPDKRFYLHKFFALHPQKNRKRMAVYAFTEQILLAACEPVFTIMDRVDTPYPEIALHIETCWIVEMLLRGYHLVNDQTSSTCYNMSNALAEIELVKKYALEPEARFPEMYDALYKLPPGKYADDWIEKIKALDKMVQLELFIKPV